MAEAAAECVRVARSRTASRAANIGARHDLGEEEPRGQSTISGRQRTRWSGRWDSNPRSRAPKARALPTTLLPGGRPIIRPTSDGLINHRTRQPRTVPLGTQRHQTAPAIDSGHARWRGMGPLKRLTRRPGPASTVNPRSQAHPAPTSPTTAPPSPPGGTAGPANADAAPGATPELPETPASASTAGGAGSMGIAPAGRTHAWTAEDQPYDRLDCPSCGTVFRDLPDAEAPCPACNAMIHVLICPEGVRHLLTATDRATFDDDWDALHARRRREEARRRNLEALRARRAMLDSYIELGVRLVELHNAPDACPACVAAAAHPYRPRAAPTLPIAGCAHDICRCLYAPARPSAAHR